VLRCLLGIKNYLKQALGQAGVFDAKKGLRWRGAFLDSRRANGFALG